MSRFIQSRPIYGAQDLLACYRDGGRQMEADDPAGARFVASLFDPGTNRPTTRTYLSAPGLKIRRTYSLTSSLDTRSALGVQVFNNVFTDMGRGARLYCHVWNRFHGAEAIMTNPVVGSKQVQGQVMKMISLASSRTRKL